jgi:ornithine carbamoyltransferase
MGIHTYPRISVCKAAKNLGLDFLEIPWSSFYGNPEVHPSTPGTALAELRSLQELGARALIARIKSQEVLENLADGSPIPVISGGTEKWHPLQALADLAVLKNHFGKNSPRIAIVGNGRGPVASSLIAAAPDSSCNLDLVVVAPPGYEPHRDLASRRAVQVESNLETGLAGADVVYLDKWFYQDLTEAEESAFRPYVVTERLIEKFAPEAKIMHCLPHADEVEATLLYGARSLVWEQVRARTSTLVALLADLLREKTYLRCANQLLCRLRARIGALSVRKCLLCSLTPKP